MSCNVRENSKKHLIKKGIISEGSKILSPMFTPEVEKLTQLARDKYGVTGQGNLYNSVYVGKTGEYKAEENTELFDELQQKFDQSQESTDPSFQTEENTQSAASPKTIALLKDFLARIGVEVKSLTGIEIMGVPLGINGIADPINKLIQYIESKEATVLPEEAMHIAVELLEQKNPKLFNEMFNKIGRYALYNEVFAQYAQIYRKDGKSDVRKIKKEAMAKILAEYVIQENEGVTENPDNIFYVRSFWERVLQFINDLFGKANFNPFKEAAKSVTEGRIDAEGVNFNGGQFFQLSPKQQEVVDKIKETEKSLKKVITKADPNPLIDTVDDNFYTFNGERVLNRVTDRVKAWYERKFGKKEFSKDMEYLYEALRQFGTSAHNDIENIIKSRIDSEGKKLKKPSAQTHPVQTNPEVYKKLEIYVDQLLSQYDDNTIFLAETMIYNPSKKGGEAGTIDFLAIKSDGSADLLDWKFMMNNGEDVAWYKQGAYNEQLETYKNTLKKHYGLTDIKRNQFVPFVIDTKFDPLTKRIYISGIVAGSADPSKIEDLRLLPVAAKSQRTDYQQINEYITKLQKLYEKLSNETVKEGRKDLKAQQLNQIMKTIRFLQVQNNLGALAEEAKVLSGAIERTVAEYNNNFSKKDIKTVTPEEIEEISEQLTNASSYVSLYDEIDVVFEELLDITDPSAKETLKKLRHAANIARRQKRLVKDAIFDFGEKFIANRFDIKNLTSAEKVVNYLVKNFRTFSKAKTKATRVLYRLVASATQRTEIQTDDFNKELKELKNEYDNWAKTKGLSPKNYYDILLKKKKVNGEEHVQHKLISKYSSEFYSKFDAAAAAKNRQWFKDNVDLDKFKVEAQKRLERELKNVDASTYFEDSKITKDERKAALIAKYNIDSRTFTGWGTPLMKAFPKDKWISEEYKELEVNPPAMKFYEFIRKINERAKEAGYITPQQEKTFLPFLRSTVSETLTMGGATSITEQFINSISSSEQEIGYGAVDPLTNKPVQTIPKYFTQDLGLPQYDEKGNFIYTDYSGVSRDMFKIMSIYTEQVVRFEEFSKLEQQAKILSYIEHNKSSIVANNFGTIQREAGQPKESETNEENAKYYDNFVKAVVYDQAYLDEGFDQRIMKVTGNTNKKINKFLGTKLLPEDMEDREVSMVKLIDQTNKLFQLKTLGLNIGTAFSNLLGGQFQTIINSGRYFTGKDFHKSEMRLSTASMTGEEGKKRLALLDFFLPISDITGRAQTQELGTTALTSNSFSDFIMGLQRNAEKFIQYSIADAYLDNLVLINGEVHNAREYLRAQPEYVNRYKDPATLKKVEKEFAGKVEELIRTNGIMNNITINDEGMIDKLEGFERISPAILKHREQIRVTARNATGNLAKEDLNQVRMSVVGRSFMVFKNWIPKLLDQRFGEFTYNEGANAYEWGRARMTMKLLIQDNLKSIPKLINVLQGNTEGIKYLEELYNAKKQQFLDETGLDESEWNITPEEFYDLVRSNIQSMLRDAAFGLILFSLLIAMKTLPDDDEMDYEEKNYYRLSLRYLDKITDEVMFFYNPSSLSSIMNGSLFPAVGVLTDASKITTNMVSEIFGDSEKSQPTKYFLKSLPVAKEFVNFVPFFSEELAKDMGIRISAESRR